MKMLKNPNEHIFATKKHNENKFNYHKIQMENNSRQLVLFEHMTQIYLTRSKYIIMSYLSFDEYYSRFDQLEDFAKQTTFRSYKVTPNLIPPADLRSILYDVEIKLKANPKLALPVVVKANVWSYYQFLKINAFVICDMLIIVLILPLIDRDLEFNLFKAHNLPLLHPELKKVFSYEISNLYIAI